MSSTTTNADTSPFLKLPPEIRSRIYDYVFGSNLVYIDPYLHTEQKSKRVGYEISKCTCEYDHTRLSPRVRAYEHDAWIERTCTDVCQSCTSSDAQRTTALDFSLPLLQVSRQIYHEAALKPFQQASFVFDFNDRQSKEAAYGFPAFMNALIPAQVKAITHLRLLSANSACIEHAKLPRLEGLKHLDIQLNVPFADSDSTSRVLEDFAANPIVGSLVKLNLRSSRAELGLDGPNFRHMKWAARQRKILEPPTKDDAEIFEKILEHIEVKLLRSSIDG